MALSKKDAASLKEAHELLHETHNWNQYGSGYTTDDHKALLKKGMRLLKGVLTPMASDQPNASEEIGEPLLISSPSKSALNQQARNDLQTVFGLAKGLSNDPEMHRAGRAMCKHAALHVKSVIMPGLDADDLAAKAIGSLALGRFPSGGVLAALKETVDARMAELPERMLGDAISSGELTL